MTIFRVEFASCYVYSPSGDSAVCARSRLLRALLKAGDARVMPRYAMRVRQQTGANSPLTNFFGDDDVLVPVPGSAPCNRHRRWLAEELADGLLQEGLGGSMWRGLKRVHAVPKSATAPLRSRPTVKTHFDSFAMERAAGEVQRIVLIDDVVTKGRTLLAAAARAHEVYPAAEIRAFALLRTLGKVRDITRLLEPCRGEIRCIDGDARRLP